jgi:hypothetical protein
MIEYSASKEWNRLIPIFVLNLMMNISRCLIEKSDNQELLKYKLYRSYHINNDQHMEIPKIFASID